MKDKLGFIGLGNMGLPMSINLLRAGYEVYGFDTNAKAMEQFIAEGGNGLATSQAVVKQSEVIMTSLPTPQVVEHVYTSEDGILQHAKQGSLLIDFSTVNPELNDSLHKKAQSLGLRYLGAPVSGGVIGAINATLTIMIGGEEKDYQSGVGIFEIVGKNIFHLGTSPSVGTRIKLLNNLMIGFYTQAVAETIVLGESMGVAADTLYEVLSNSYGQSRIYERNYLEYMKNENYEPGFSTNLLLKDLRLAKNMADEAGVPLLIGEQLVNLYNDISAEGFGENDMSAAYLSLKEKCMMKQN
ncbi:NAD(P)-dependent oxidoreductase [Lysinibacillus sphaericus]|uniref:2-hydroxy-3-oxopropionate reductase n=1 Tax=Lysinibacillus sphaericus TaxID=1421 RepID=A0A2S0K4D3_LYSSH|nr:NAD(P)-dependent oxidoreductase [Lysinibacillus sphaericus]AVK98227.1 3-hydroxyisobutyrate dehydrogenase [Lysinibacillus sphaericus]MED4543734.1 NAD(P)-dependent oxidoreductase [Lysinibacillus sphaericus]TKI19223.1 NAD(P)-dependent oxidoreductase [Lysinibacillus sphaericus]SUV15823.1 putative 2-hydroxy-3-oxopropionate reductase [Lysinibacillus sphaericus]GEC81557.1 2-hydroxy-3-oxopropionate reductase [Lysinibacillus sphaericus]